jgi:S-adenosylmethionine:tRNA ribosyltransferase-isomerase
VLVSEFNYELPEELIAQEPLAERAGSRLLHVKSGAGLHGIECQEDEFPDFDLRDRDLGDRDLSDRQFRDFPEMLRPSDLLVFNDTRVFPARLYGRRGGLRAQAVSAQNPAARDFLRGRIEVLLTRQIQQEPNEWECLVRPGRKIGVGEHLFFGQQDELEGEVLARGDFGERRIRFASALEQDFFGLVERIGHVPLPPYITREMTGADASSSSDRERYQTVYARNRGSVAAPTAGLHFTPEILERIRERGVETAEVTLHVGLGTFQPVRSERVEEHELHSESYFISDEAAKKINRARSESRRVVAVGTTTVRTLEYAAQLGGDEVRAGMGEANLFIYPGYRFRVVQALLTNFHLPLSSLLMLVCALGGKENVLRAYRHAVSRRYRFYSYGDCMFVE